jgi:pilus assembly protein CpaB
MNPRRLAIALFVALLLSAAVTYLVSRTLGGRYRSGVPTQKYVAASRALQSGDVLKPDSLMIVDWPTTIPLQGAFTKVDDVVGRSVLYPVANGQPILDGSLAASGSGIGLTVKIPEGMRAISVRSDEIVGVAGFLFPGSRVDVLVTLRTGDAASSATQIVLQDVEVLTVGQNYEPDPQGKPQKVGVVTLLLTPEDAQKLVLAGTQGTIQFVLRNGADHDHVKAFPVQVAQLSGGSGPKAPVSERPRPAVKRPYVVETILGDKRTTNQFE